MSDWQEHERKMTLTYEVVEAAQSGVALPADKEEEARSLGIDVDSIFEEYSK